MSSAVTNSAVASSSLGQVQAQSITFSQRIELTSRGVLNGFELVYECYGELNSAASNAILICHALSGDHHAAGHYGDAKTTTGWWDSMIGPDKPVDTNRFFVVCVNNIGGCGGSTGPSSIDPNTKQPYGTHFPIVTVEDWVRTQAILSDHLGVSQWAAVIGGSLGGMQALQWSITFPERIKHAILIATAPKLNAQNIGFNDVARQAIRTDPEFFNGDYYQHQSAPSRGMRVARMLGHITYLSESLMGQKFGRNLRQKATFDYEFAPEFEVESYLRYQGDSFVNRFDANTYLLMTKALDYFDPAAKTGDDLTQALAPAMAKFLVVSFNSDWRFSSERSKEIVRALQGNKCDVSYADIDSPHGHDSFLLHNQDYFDLMYAYMDQVANSCGST